MNNYSDKLKQHYEGYFGIPGNKFKWGKGPIETLHPEFYILEFEPNERHEMWTYATLGMSLDRNDENLIELFIFSPWQDDMLVELLTVTAFFHRNTQPLNLNHTLNFGKPWLDDSKCDHGFISLPYLDGEDLELFHYQDNTYHCYWLIPITAKERDYKIKNGYESLEELFESKGLDYLNVDRDCLI
ncbi:MAG: suppressor of fused domain protein [Cyclobacteriaceae bacterium]|nr:suppressor of fused domain protein [Cyclobacteriaceae bacterium]